MPSLLTEVKTKMSIHAHRKTRGLIEGTYGSVFKGRSMDFDDLREYISGDDTKDIDWKATARSNSPLIKRYIAIRKHNILLVVDTGRNMSAISASGTPKKSIAIMLAGMIGLLAIKNGDLVALVSGSKAKNSYIPLKGSSPHLEMILQKINTDVSTSAPKSDLTSQLEFVSKSIRRRMMIFIISDDLAITPDHDRLIRRLQAQHELFWLTIGDADLTSTQYLNNHLYDTADDTILPAFIRSNKSLAKELQQATQIRRDILAQFLARMQIVSERIESEPDVPPALFRLLERHKHARR